MTLAEVGFGGRFEAEAAQWTELCPARVVSQSRGLYRVVTEAGELLAGVSGRFRFETALASDFPAVGDFVLLDRATDENGNGVIGRLLTRKSAFIRKAAGTAGEDQVVAANVDTLLVCMALGNDFSPRRLERYLTLGWDSGATPVVALTKADGCDRLAERVRAAQSAAVGADVLTVSSFETGGLDALAPYLKPGRTLALIGSSGVGKSTLLNRLLGEERLAVGGLRGDEKGRHTTTRRELVPLPCGALVIDTPGMREMGLWEAGEGLEQTFADVEALASRCRFANCTHAGEPGCAVEAALARGELDAGRWASYLRLRQEATYADDRQRYLAAKEKKFKNIALTNKANERKRK